MKKRRVEQTETACRQAQLYDLLSKLRRYSREMIFKWSKLKRPRVSYHLRRSTMMRPRQVNKAAVAGINRVQPNHHRKVITKLLNHPLTESGIAAFERDAGVR